MSRTCASGVAPAKARMRGDDRRHQLLDVAAAIIVGRGPAEMSMERLAAEAGVSKALPYKHFANSDEVLTELYRRETSALGRHVWQSLSDAPVGSDLVRVGVRAYFDAVVERGAVLAALSRPGSTIASVADPGQAGVIFEVEVLNRFHGLSRERAKAVAGIVQGAVVGAAGTLHAGHSGRRELEDDLVTVITELVRGATSDSPT